jgi:hypothetical protein
MMLEVPRQIDPHDHHLLQRLVHHAVTFLRLHGATHDVAEIVRDFYALHFGDAVNLAWVEEAIRVIVRN